MKPALALLFFLLLTAASYCSAENKDAQAQPHDSVKIQKIIKQITKENIFSVDVPEGNRSSSFLAFAQSGSSYDFLRIAMENKNAVVRLYAFKAVAERMDDLPQELVEKFKNDRTLVRVRQGGTVKEMPLNEIANGFLK